MQTSASAPQPVARSLFEFRRFARRVQMMIRETAFLRRLQTPHAQIAKKCAWIADSAEREELRERLRQFSSGKETSILE